jgi:hypothetical protein
VGDSRFLPSGITRRSTVGVTGFTAEGPAKSRVRIGGQNGQEVQEQVVDITVPYVQPDEITPFWSADERFMFYASNQSAGTAADPFPPSAGPTSRYRLFRISANATDYGVTPGTQRTVPTAITDPANTTFDYLYPTLNASGSQIAFVRSADGKPINDPTKVWHLYVANAPANGAFIDVLQGGAGNLTGLTVNTAGLPRTFPGANGQATPFETVGRPSFLGNNEVVFSARLTGEQQFHLFQANIQSGRLLQLTGGAANERNPSVSPDARNIAFDSDAQPSIGPGGTEPYSVGIPRQELLPGNVPSSAGARNGSGNRNVFNMRLIPNQSGSIQPYTVTQITNRQGAGAADTDNVEPTWSSQNPVGNNINPGPGQFPPGNASRLYLAWASTRVATGNSASPNHDIYFGLVSTTATTGGESLIAPEGTLAPTLQLNTGDAANNYDDRFPTFAPFIRVFRIGFHSDRNGNLVTNNFPNVPGGADVRGFTKTPGRNDIFIATVIDITAPTLIRFNTNSATGEIVHTNIVSDPTRPYDPGRSARTRDDGILPGSRVHFAVRVDDRESGMRPDQAVYLQIKNPNSKYQAIQQGSANPAEHKEYLNAFPLSYTLEESVGSVFAPVNYVLMPGGAGPIIKAYGPEYEAEAIGITNQLSAGIVTNNAVANTSYFMHPQGAFPGQTPDPNRVLYEAGQDDFLAFTGGAHPPLDGRNGRPAVWLELKPLYQREADGSFRMVNGQPVPEVPTDNQGGVLYGATLTIPSEASDWYIDVILYDNAVNPFNTAQQSNFIIYDNIWGFSSAAPISGGTAQDLLVVSDYTLGQKFFRARFDTDNVSPTGGNLLPIFYGAESYFTDVDINKFMVDPGPATVPSTVPSGNQFDPSVQAPTVGTNINFYDRHGPFQLTNQAGNSPPGLGLKYGIEVPNTLGVKAYVDQLLDPFGTIVDGKNLTDVNRYTIWRVLARGPLPRNILQSYLPVRTTRPADIRAGETAPQPVVDTQRMVIWSSPFTGNVFAGSGTLLDLQTQNDLRDYVQQGGRLFVSGQDIGFALKGNGGQQANEFFDNVLQARFVQDNQDDFNVAAAGGGNFPYSLAIQRDPWTRAQHAYGIFASPNWVYSPPNSGGTFITRIHTGAGNADWKGDGAFTAEALGGRNDVIAAGVGGPLSARAPQNEFNYGAGGGGMISSSYGQGYAVYAAFGFESLSQGWYNRSVTGGTGNVITTLGRRTEIMHNITCALRSGTITGRLIDNTGAPVAGALVRAVATIGVEPNAAAGTALTDRDGNFQIVGLNPDEYVIFGYKPGYFTQHSAATLMHGASRSAINLALKTANPGALSGSPLPLTTYPQAAPNNQGGVFTPGGVPIPNINVQARIQNPDGTWTVVNAISSDGTQRDPVTNQVLPAGAYRFPALLIGDYIVIANPDKTYGTDGRTLIDNPLHKKEFSTAIITATPNPSFQTNEVIKPGPVLQDDGRTVTGLITINENVTATVNFFLVAAPQRITGRVVGMRDPNGNPDDPSNQVPIQNAVVTATAPNSTTVVASGTTDANGVYQLSRPADPNDPNADLTLINGGTYVITVISAPGYALTNPPSPRITTTVVLTSNQPETAQTLVLVALPPGSVSGLVTFSVTGTNSTTSGVGGTVINLFQVATINGNEQIATNASYSVVVANSPTTENGYQFNWRITNVAPGDYLVRVVPQGTQTATPSQVRITVATGQETRNVNFQLQPPKIYAPGLQLISLPADFPGVDPRSIFTFENGGDTTFRIAEWTGTEYRIADDDAELRLPLVPIRVGKGYFVRFGSLAAVNPQVPGARVTTPQYTVSLVAGWNLIGNPFANQTDPTKSAADLLLTNPQQATFTYTAPNGTSRVNASFDTAVTDGAVQRSAYEYISQTGSYVQRTALQPYIGYWFKTAVPVQITYTYPGGGRAANVPVKVDGKYRTVTRAEMDTRATRSITSRSLTDWRLQIGARQGDLQDADNSIGVSPEAKEGFDFTLDNEKPPMVTEAPGVYVAIQGSGPGGRATALTDSIVGANGGKKSWTFTVETTAASNGDVTLYWPNVSRLPRGIEPILTDLATGRRVAMRSGAGAYKYALNGRAKHEFKVEVAPPSSLPLDIVNVRSVVTRSIGAQGAGNSVRFGFTVTREADVDADVKTLTGRSVRHLSTRSLSGAESGLTWDFRDGMGARVPAGTYVLSITARDPETGATARRQIMVTNLN